MAANRLEATGFTSGENMTTRWARVARGQLVAAFATFAAAFSHGIAGGGHPPLFAIALALAFSSIGCVALAGVRLSRLRLGASVAISQLLYHGVFSLFGSVAAPGGAMTSHHHGALVFSPAVLPAGAPAVPASDPWMLIAHLGAAVLTFTVIVHGDRVVSALGSVAALVVGVLSRLGNSALPTPVQSRQPSGHRVAVPHRSSILSSSLAHRGPPGAPRFA